MYIPMSRKNSSTFLLPSFIRMSLTRPYDIIYSNEEERMHIHVLYGGHEAKYWLEPCVELAKNTGIPEHKLNEIKKIIEKYADSFKEQFRQHIGKRIDD